MLEEEVYSQNSPIWDQDFMVSSSQTGQLGIQTGNLHLAMGWGAPEYKDKPVQVMNSKEWALSMQLYK